MTSTDRPISDLSVDEVENIRLFGSASGTVGKIAVLLFVFVIPVLIVIGVAISMLAS